MKAQDFRIGNLVDRGDYICTVESISKDGIMTEPLHNEGERFVEQELKPIPLTEEWLVKFGFEKHSGIYFRTLGYSAYIAIGNDGSCGLYNNLSSYNRGTSFNQLKDVDFVHQLQNLYFAITGEELTLQNIKQPSQ